MPDLLEVTNVSKSFAGSAALRSVSFSVSAGEIVCLLGPSGCGKTTLLRIVAGLEEADAGIVLFEGRPMNDVAPYDRHFGLMFQDFALFPHKNVFDNVAFGLRMMDDNGSTENTPSIRDTVGAMLELVGLTGFEKRNVSELSGGEAQRVALARSLAPHPRFLMLDEPLGSLDRATRERLMVEVRDILRRVGVTALYVTHDQSEAFSIADRAIIMNRGSIEQEGTPESLYRKPATEFVARFLGLSNMVAGTVVATDQVECPWGRLAVSTSGLATGARVTVLVRPEAARLPSGVRADASHGATSSRASQVRGRLVSKTFRDGRYRIRLTTDGGPELAFDLEGVRPLAMTTGASVVVNVDPAGVVLLPTGL